MINAHAVSRTDDFDEAVFALPALPSILRYDDDYEEKARSIRPQECHECADLFVDGEIVKIQFRRPTESIQTLVRHFLLQSLQTKAPASVVNYYRSLRVVDDQDIRFIAVSSPSVVRAAWAEMSVRYRYYELAALKSLLGYLCQIGFKDWSPLYADFASRALNVNRPDPYATVRAGSCFLGVDEEARLIRWIDQMAQCATELDKQASQLACLVACSYQFGMRPKQLGMLRKRDCTVRRSEEDGSWIVHLVFRMIKQRDKALSGMPLTRKVKREWASLFVALDEHQREDDGDSYFFGFRSSQELAGTLIKQLDRIVPGAEITAYDLRHSMAQRLVDSGASQEELASALGHSVLRTGLVYFQASANHAELVNQALAASPTYQAVAKVAKEKFIEPEELLRLRGEEQVAGVPHGIPIAGIGGCTVGQPACPNNPVMACYGCPKFMPVNDVGIHAQVLQEFRNVVVQFKDIGYGEVKSPAYLQLQRTLSEVQAVIAELDGQGERSGGLHDE